MTTIYGFPDIINQGEGINKRLTDELMDVSHDSDTAVLQLAAQNSTIAVPEMKVTLDSSKTTFERAVRRLKAAGRINTLVLKNGQWAVKP